MQTVKAKTYHIDGDTLQSTLRYDPTYDLWFEDYIDFENEPRYTPSGRRWKSATDVGCPYADPKYRDCGTCPHLRKQHPRDLIGVCFHEELRLPDIPESVSVVAAV